MGRSIHRGWGGVIWLFLIVGSPVVWATGETETYCQDTQVNRHWHEAMTTHREDPLVMKLYAVRRGLCEMLAEHKIDSQSARFMWDQAVISALVEKGREATGSGALLRLFGTF